jgi:hypothetical protein
MWDVVWHFAAWTGLCIMVVLSIANIISLFKSTYEFSESVYGLLFHLLIAFLCYSYLFPEDSAEINTSAYTKTGSSFRYGGFSDGDSRPKNVQNDPQIEDSGSSCGFGNDGVSEYDAPYTLNGASINHSFLRLKKTNSITEILIISMLRIYGG